MKAFFTTIIIVVLILVGCTKGVVPSFSVLNSANNAWPFIDGGSFDGFSSYLFSPSRTPALAVLNNQLYLVSTGLSGGINTYLYNGNDSVPNWNYYGFFSPQPSPGTAINPSLTVFSDNNLYASWVEINTGTADTGISQLHAGILNGTTWIPIDGSTNCGLTLNCLNNLGTQDANSPAIVTSNLGLNLFWTESAAGVTQVRGLHSSTGGTTPAWTLISSGGLNFVNVSASNSGFTPQSVGFNSKLYVTWAEDITANTSPAALHVAYSLDGITFNNVDGTIPAMSQSGANGAMTPFLAANNGNLYLAWIGSFGGGPNVVRVAVYNGNDVSPAWSYVDGGTGLNFNSSFGASTPRMIAAPNNQLYITWTELNSLGVTQTRVARYNGGASWNFIDGGNSNGLNYNPATNAFSPSLTIFNGRMYSSWEELGGQDLSRVRFLPY